MKQFFTILLFFTGVSASSAQAPLYIQFDQSCMSQLEYRYTYTGQDLLMYAINKSEDELYFFKIGGNTPITTPTQPRGTVSCRSVNLSSGEVNAINAGGRLAYIVHKVQSGYLSMPVEAAGQIFRAGTSFVFRSPSYDFLLDTANIDYARNLSQPGVVSPVYLTGIRDIDCRRQYSFRLEPLSDDLPRMDIEVIPGIGVVSNRAGRNGSEMEQNVYRLLKINGIGMEDYIYETCRDKMQNNNPDSYISGWPQNPADGNNDNSPFMEPDKEGYSPRPSGQEGNQPFSNCPEKPGFGYHIVQQGESLHSIARAYSLDAKTLAGWNRITDLNKIEVCQKIWLSPQSGTVTPNTTKKEHVVQKGETIAGIARKYNLSETSLRKMNGMPASGNVVINPGQRLVVSSGQANPFGSSGSGTGGGSGSGPGPAITTTSQQYRVRKGETISSVSRKYGYTTEYFRHINRQLRNLPADDNTAIAEGVILTVSDSKCERSELATFKPAGQGQSNTWNSPGNKPAGTDAPNSPSFGSGGGTGARFEYVGEYIVKTGDTMLSIARQYNLSVEKLAAANGYSAGREPLPREILKIPK